MSSKCYQINVINFAECDYIMWLYYVGYVGKYSYFSKMFTEICRNEYHGVCNLT